MFKTYYDFFILLCAISCSIQLITITTEFLKYPVLETIEISFPSTIEIPDLTICTQFLYAINWTYFLNHHINLITNYTNCKLQGSTDEQLNQTKSFFNEMGQWEFQPFVEKHFTYQQFYKSVIKSNELIDEIKFWTNNQTINIIESNPLKEIDCSHETFIKDPHVCYHVGCRNKTAPTEAAFLTKSDLNYGPMIGSIMQVTLNRSYFDHWEHAFVYIHSPLSLPYGDEVSSIMINSRNEGSIFYLSYKRLIVNLLPLPYQTDCLDYLKQFKVSRANLYEQCVNNKTKSEYKFINYQTIIREPEKFNYKFSNRLRFNYSDQLDQIYSQCKLLVNKSQCNQRYFIPYSMGYEQLFDQQSANFLIVAPVDPEINKTCVAKINLVNYFVSIGSILGTWFGFSVVKNLGHFLDNLIITIKSKQQVNQLRSKKFNQRFKRKRIDTISNRQLT